MIVYEEFEFEISFTALLFKFGYNVAVLHQIIKKLWINNQMKLARITHSQPQHCVMRIAHTYNLQQNKDRFNNHE